MYMFRMEVIMALKTGVVKTHMAIPWHEYVAGDDEVPIKEAPLKVKASVIGRLGSLMLSGGTTAWRTRSSMMSVARTLDITCSADVGMDSISFTCMDGTEMITQTFTRGGPGVNTQRIADLEDIVKEFDANCDHLSAEKILNMFDRIAEKPESHSTPVIAVTSGIACVAMAINLGAGITELIGIFLAAGLGQLLRKILNKKGLSLFIPLVLSAAFSCMMYGCAMFLARTFISDTPWSGAGYVISMLYLVPGFPFITSVLDFAKMDLRSGIERLAYSGIIMLVITMVSAVASIVVDFDVSEFTGIALAPVLEIVLRLAAGFAGIYGFALAFNSTHKMALTAALTGFVPSVIRYLLVEYTGMPTAAAAFIQAFLVGLIAYFVVKYTGMPRVAITIPAVVISVPGYYIFRSVYSFVEGDAVAGMNAFLLAAVIIFSLAMGIVFSRFITDPHFRHRD